nr:PREDICTED: putative odorant receptor 71a [Tribolium castaneum]|eukprot:XP_015837915.1 PREDICTED: putative odorant receptor 71a [Tribolium castaneum]
MSEDYTFRNVFAREKKILTISGFYPLREYEKNYFHFFSGTIQWIISLGMLFSMIIQSVIKRNDLMVLSETLYFLTTHLTFVCKLANLEYHKKLLLDIEDMLKTTRFQKTLSLDLIEKTGMNEKIRKFNLVAKTFRIVCVWCVVLYVLVPYFDPGKSKTLPTPGWFPFNWTDKYYYGTYFFEVAGISITAHMDSSIDILSWLLVTIASFQCDILKENLKNIYYNYDKEHDIRETFKDCIRHHEEIIKFTTKVEQSFSQGILLQFLCSALVICFTGFLMLVVPVLTFQFANTIMYFCCMMIQLGMYCWYGHEIMTTSDEIGQYFYLANWYDSSLTLRKDFAIFLERAKRPITLTAGGFVVLSLNTFTRILRSSYSYFAVLKHLYNKS